MDRGSSRGWICAAVALCTVLVSAPGAEGDLPLVYSSVRGDPWNRIFSLLFTRTVRVSRTEEFADAGPFAGPPQFPATALRLRVSTRTFEQHEDGDRAIEALYPSFITQKGTNYILEEPHRTELAQAVQDALDERVARAPLDRALMQADLWSAFDALDPVMNGEHETARRRRAAASLVPAIARLIGRVALTDGQIAGLPDNYAAARRTMPLPDVFARDGEWMEVVMSPVRMHDQAADMRRASRVFVKPLHARADETAFLKDLGSHIVADVAMSALVMQTLLIDSRGRAVVSPLISDVQIRTPSHTAATPGGVEEFELSRGRLRTDPAGGGFRHFPITAPAYFPLAMNDYGFATPARDRSGELAPVLGTLGARCAACHGLNGAAFATFSMVHGPGTALPPVVRLREPNDDRARVVAAAKETRAEFARLVAAAGIRR